MKAHELIKILEDGGEVSKKDASGQEIIFKMIDRSLVKSSTSKVPIKSEIFFKSILDNTVDFYVNKINIDKILKKDNKKKLAEEKKQLILKIDKFSKTLKIIHNKKNHFVKVVLFDNEKLYLSYRNYSNTEICSTAAIGTLEKDGSIDTIKGVGFIELVKKVNNL